MKITNSTIKKILKKYEEITMLGKISATLAWDLNVNLPPRGAPARAEESAYLAELIVSKWHDPEFRTLIEKANTEKDLSLEEKAIVRNLNYGAKYYYKIPKDIIIEKEKVTSGAFIDWREARETNTFKKFQPHLEKIVELDRKIASHLGYKDNPYDALLDLYEPELTAAECKRLFDGMREGIVPLVKKITKSKNYTDSVPFINGKVHYPRPEQEKILKFMMRRMGFDFSSGRVDVSAHPFTTNLSRYDVRVTTFYNEFDFRESFTSTTHETGHALYELGVNPSYDRTPLESGVSLGIHEALSRFWENMVGKNMAFLENSADMFQSHYAEQLGNVSPEEIAKSMNLVKPSLIRIHADEVTYSLHIVLRFEMENALINGKIDVKDASEAWREKSKKLLGVAPEKNSEGVLQDVHWAYGNFGYFPAYALGNLYGAQFLSAMKKDFKFDEEVGKGNLLPVKEWLDRNVHVHGSLYFPGELVKKVTGKPLDYSYFIDYLTKKFSAIYGF